MQQVMRGGKLGPDSTNHAGYQHMRHMDALSVYGDGREHFLGQCQR